MVTLGAEGALVYEPGDGGGFTHVKAPEVGPTRGASLVDATRLAVAAAALSTTAAGARGRLPTREEAEGA